jgi:uncharacterized protein
MRTCPVCKNPVGPRPENRFFPFCRERCKLIDLGQWFSGGYRVPGKAEEEEDEVQPGEGGPAPQGEEP